LLSSANFSVSCWTCCCHLGLRRLKFLGPGFELGLLDARIFLLRLLLISRLLQLLPQLPQFGFQFASPLANLARLSFGTFPAFDFPGQRFRSIA